MNSTTTLKKATEIDTLYAGYKSHIRLHLRPDGAFIGGADSAPVNPSQFVALDAVLTGRVKPSGFINLTGSRVAAMMDGRHRVGEIAASLAEGLNGDAEALKAHVREFIQSEVDRGWAELRPQAFGVLHRVTGSTQYYHPTCIQLELTYRCNCNCLHCYVEGGEAASAYAQELPAQEIIRILKTVFDRGASAIEITGGEALLHPGFWEVLEYAASRSMMTCVLTNGLLVNEEVVDRIKQFPLAGMGVSLDGPNADVHDYLRNCPGSFAAATRAIRLLTSRTDIPVRAAMTIYRRNYDLIDETIELARRLGAHLFASGPVMSNGRGYSAGDSIALSSVERWVMWEALKSNIEKYGPLFMSARLNTDRVHNLVEYVGNCGVASKDATIGPSGNVRPCLMSPRQLVLGNLSTMSYEEVFSKNGRIGKLPNTGGTECDKCPALVSCKPCVLKGLQAYSRMRVKGAESCNWGRVHQVSDILDELGWSLEGMAGCGCAAASGCDYQCGLST